MEERRGEGRGGEGKGGEGRGEDVGEEKMGLWGAGREKENEERTWILGSRNDQSMFKNTNNSRYLSWLSSSECLSKCGCGKASYLVSRQKGKPTQAGKRVTKLIKSSRGSGPRAEFRGEDVLPRNVQKLENDIGLYLVRMVV